MRFKKGTFVEIKSWNELAKEFGVNWDDCIPCRCSFTTDMKYLCGRQIVLKIDLDDKSYFRYEGWNISTDMIKLANKNRRIS